MEERVGRRGRRCKGVRLVENQKSILSANTAEATLGPVASLTGLSKDIRFHAGKCAPSRVFGPTRP